VKYRKKPVVIEAWRIPPFSVEAPVVADPPPLFVVGGAMEGKLHPGAKTGDIAIVTLEGVMRANPGDWIIQGVKGELYPCENDIFEATYEAVSCP
jgi:hypothetical protein